MYWVQQPASQQTWNQPADGKNMSRNGSASFSFFVLIRRFFHILVILEGANFVWTTRGYPLSYLRQCFESIPRFQGPKGGPHFDFRVCKFCTPKIINFIGCPPRWSGSVVGTDLLVCRLRQYNLM